METFFDVLGQCPLFRGVPEGELELVLACLGARTARYDRKQTVMHAGGPAGELGVVLAGSVDVVRNGYDGRRSVIGRVGPGELFAEAYACAQVEQLPVSVEAAQACVVLRLSCARLLRPGGECCGMRQLMVHNLLRAVVEKNLRLNEKLELLAKGGTREKLLAYLSAQAAAQGGGEAVIPYDRQGLADYLGVERSAMCAELGKLRREGRLRLEKNRFQLL